MRYILVLDDIFNLAIHGKLQILCCTIWGRVSPLLLFTINASKLSVVYFSIQMGDNSLHIISSNLDEIPTKYENLI